MNTALAASLATIPDGPAKDDGIRVGRLAADAIVLLRAAENPALIVTAPSSTAVGRWRPTLPYFSPGAAAQARYLTPWTMRSAAQFRPGPPPALTSAIYTADYNEIRVLGSRGNTNRTAEQAASAELREKGEDWLTDIYSQHPLPLLESARRDALVWMVGMDSQIQIFETKYVYNFWRPITAIQNGAIDGNNDTPGDAVWMPFLDTHNHPDYPSALVLNTAAIVEMLIQFHGDNFSFSATSLNPAQTRTFAKLSDYIEDAITARVVGGTHFRNTCNISAEVGRLIGRHAFENYLRPVPRLHVGPQQPGEFTLFLEMGRPVPYVVETSSDLVQWQPWQTNVYGKIPHTRHERNGRWSPVLPNRVQATVKVELDLEISRTDTRANNADFCITAVVCLRYGKNKRILEILRLWRGKIELFAGLRVNELATLGIWLVIPSA